MTAAKTNTSRVCLIAVLLCALPGRAVVAQEAATLVEYHLDTAAPQQWRLPERLNEISGLALSADGRLFAVADEMAIVYELDIEAGRIRKSFAYGEPVMRGDFEGIAVVGERVYLMTSDGLIVSGREGDDGETLPAESHATGLGRACELEGLAQDVAHDRLLLACKESRSGRPSHGLTIFVWSLRERALLRDQAIEIPLYAVLQRLRSRRLNPSGIAVDPRSGHLLLVAARQRAVIELSGDGRLLAAATLRPATRHRQPEGIEVLADGRLLIADEGGSHKARLAIYARQPASGETGR